jgi:hypothetical protein
VACFRVRNRRQLAHRDRFSYSLVVRHMMYTAGMARWCTVTVTDAEGVRHSIDVRGEHVRRCAFVRRKRKEQAGGDASSAHSRANGGDGV